MLKTEPDWSGFPSEIPPAIRHLLQSCLHQGSAAAGGSDISTALFVLEKAACLAASASVVSHDPAGLAPPRRSPVAAALVTSSVASGGLWFASRALKLCRLASHGYSVPLSGTAALTINGVDRDLAITPDGSHLIYVGNRGSGGTQLFVRPLDTLESVPVFTGAPRGPFVSPDGLWIGFMDARRVEESAGERRAGSSPSGD